MALPRHISPPTAPILDEDRVRRLVSGVRPARDGDVRLVQRRHRNEVFAVGADEILKLYTKDGHSKLHRKVQAHARLTERPDLCVPRILGVGWIAEGHPWSLETRVPDGRHPEDEAADTSRHRALGSWLAKLHSIPVPATYGSWPGGGPSDLAPYVQGRVIPALEAAEAGDLAPRPLLAAVRGVLERLVRCVEACAAWPVFVHGAYSGANAFAAPKRDGTWSVTGVFDFEDAHPGDPLEDFAWVGIYGLDTPMLRAFGSGYLEDARIGSAPGARLALWVAKAALEALEWAPRLGDAPYAAQARKALDELVLTGGTGADWLTGNDA